MIKNYGLVIDEVKDPNAYVLGGLTSLPKTVLQPDGDWTPYLPTYEPQFGETWDTQGCTVWGTLNVIEILVKKLTGREANYSERFNYIIGKVRPPGSDPHRIAEVIRSSGVIDESTLPFTKTFEEFITPDPMTGSLLALGQRWGFELKHEYVWNTPQTKEDRTAKIRENLRYSPLGVAVTAWNKQGEVYVDDGQPNSHWCVLFGEAENGWKIFDSYDQSVKILSFDHKIAIAKRYLLIIKKPAKNWLVDLVERFVALLKTKPMKKTILELATEKLNIDFTDNSVDNEYSCSYAVTTILKENDPTFPIVVNTGQLDKILASNPKWERIYEPEAGCVIVSPTGEGKNPDMPNGHTGIFLDEDRIASNDSATGLWKNNYDRISWRTRYHYRGKYPVRLYRKIA